MEVFITGLKLYKCYNCLDWSVMEGIILVLWCLLLYFAAFAQPAFAFLTLLQAVDSSFSSDSLLLALFA